MRRDLPFLHILRYLVRIRGYGYFLMFLFQVVVELYFSLWVRRARAWEGVGDHNESWYSCLLAIGTPPMNKSPRVKRRETRIGVQFAKNEIERDEDEVHWHQVVRCQDCSAEDTCYQARVDGVDDETVDQRVRLLVSRPHFVKEE